jgi:hypothetical protein
MKRKGRIAIQKFLSRKQIGNALQGDEKKKINGKKE